MAAITNKLTATAILASLLLAAFITATYAVEAQEAGGKESGGGGGEAKEAGGKEGGSGGGEAKEGGGKEGGSGGGEAKEGGGAGGEAKEGGGAGGEAKEAGGKGGGGGEAPQAGGSGGGGGGGDAEEASKFCAATDFKQTCEKSLENAKGKEPQDLIKAAFDASVEELEKVIKDSEVYKTVKEDPMTSKALAVCEEVLNDAIDDLRRSVAKIDKIDSSKLNDNIADLRNWLSATVSHKETCIDSFENTTGETGEKVKELLKTSSELLSNGLAMVSQLQKVLSSIDDLGDIIDRLKGGQQRQLLGVGDEEEQIPDFIGLHARRLMAAPAATLKPDAVVAKDGSGQFKTITDAVNTVPKKNTKPFVIFVKAGIYKEYVMIAKGQNNIVLIGEGPLKTRITGNKCVKGGTPTFHSGTLTVTGESFFAKDIGIENTAPESQAVAMRINADMGVFQNVHFDGFQDTLYAHSYRQFFRDCRISGTIDFIFGDGKTIMQNCNILVRKPLPNQACMVTAQGRADKKSDGVIVIQGCTITAEKAFIDAQPPHKAFLGRPWKLYSRTIIMHTNIGGFIQPTGWSEWTGTFALDTLYYGEWANSGPGSDLSQRVKWKGIQKMTAQTAEGFTPQKVFVYDDWIKKTGVPYVPGMLPAAPK